MMNATLYKFSKQFAVVALLALSGAFAFDVHGIDLTVGRIQQRYPWNGLVDIDYTVTTGDATALGVDDSLEVVMIDNSLTPAVTNRALTFLQAPLPLTEGQHRVTWCANADGVTNYVEDAEFHVKVVHYAEAYMVIDVSGGSTTNVYSVDFLNGAPLGGFNTDEYKGDKIVLRLIRPGSYLAGSPKDEANRISKNEEQHRVAISRPFYIGIFEMTQQQYENVMGSNPSANKSPYHPVETVSSVKVRGGNWPTVAAPGENTFMAKLLEKCKSKNPETGAYDIAVTGFDLPTEFQWEYACRAGTTKAFNGTDDFNNTSSSEQQEQMDNLGRYKGNGGSTAGHAAVGSYQPNAWGLYDMHGNVWEWCLDRFTANVPALKQFVDPKGPVEADVGINRVNRGRSYSSSVGECRSALREYGEPGNSYATGGFRLVRAVPQ